MGTARACVSGSQHDLTGQLVLDVYVELLDPSLLDIGIFGSEIPHKVNGSRRWREKGESIRKPDQLSRANIGRSAMSGTVGGRGGAATELCTERFRSERRIRPQSLTAHTPGGVVIHGVTATNHRFVAAKHLPGSANAWFKCGPIHLNSGTGSRLLTWLQGCCAPRTRNQPPVACSRWNEIRHPALSFRNRSCHAPSQSQVDGQVSVDVPIVLDKRTVDLPSSAGNIPGVVLVVNPLNRQPHQNICYGVAKNARRGES